MHLPPGFVDPQRPDYFTYAEEILKHAHMQSNPCRNLVNTKSRLGVDGDLVSDPMLYQSLAGALRYLTFTRPNISYAVQQVCLYMHGPREPLLVALKRILRYAGCPVTHRSTLNYCVFLGDNLLAWSAKRQVTVSRSSVEAKYRCVANVVAKNAWFQYADIFTKGLPSALFLEFHSSLNVRRPRVLTAGEY
uniref:Ribonuclease H-like domain-containing protein n=1 Tax=Tanacetum cinerariifolium TaxID=118510 RepID=A0A699IRS0_TANCI|nr:ribonuclease H-like domain-containing protein [Tanacetum cinerariifolium]